MSGDSDYQVEGSVKFNALPKAFPIIKGLSVTATKKVESALSALEKRLEVLPDEE